MEGDVIVIWTLYVDDVFLLGKYLKVLGRIKKKLTSRFSMPDMGDVSLVPGMGITRNRTKGAVTITQDNYMKSPLEQCGMVSCNPAYIPGVGMFDQSEKELWNKESKQLFKALIGSIMYLG